jgi:hypothetical protein
MWPVLVAVWLRNIWLLADCPLGGADAAENALHYVAPVGEKEQYLARALENVMPFLERSDLAVR